MKDRLKELRKSMNLNQQEFAEKIGINRGTLANYEVGRNVPIDAVIKLICDTFHVSEQWLRTGEGEMYIQMDKGHEMHRLVDQLLADDSQEMKKRLATAVLRLSPEQMDSVLGWIKGTFNLVEDTTAANRANTTAAGQSTTTSAPDAPDTNVGEMTIDEKVESYRQELLAVEQAKKRDGEVTA